MTDRNFYRLRVVVSNDSALSDIHVEAEIKEYFWLSSAYGHDLDTKLAFKVKEAIRIVKKVRMIDIELVKGSTTWGSHDTHVDAYRIIERGGYPSTLVMSRHNGNSIGAVFNFDNAPVVEVSDIVKRVKSLQKFAYELWKKEWVEEKPSF